MRQLGRASFSLSGCDLAPHATYAQQERELRQNQTLPTWFGTSLFLVPPQATYVQQERELHQNQNLPWRLGFSSPFFLFLASITFCRHSLYRAKCPAHLSLLA